MAEYFKSTCVNGKWTCDTVPCQGLSEKGRVPKIIALEAYQQYQKTYGSSQSFNRLNERGGFGADEIMMLLYERIKKLEEVLSDDQKAMVS